MSRLPLCISNSKYFRTNSLILESPLLGWFRHASGAVKDREPLKKATTPQGRFDKDDEKTKDALERFPDNVNPVTKEKGGPRGPEPTRYGDWERKGSSSMTFHPMDTTQCSHLWKMLVPDTSNQHGTRLTLAEDFASNKRELKWEKEQPPKTVTMAPTSRFLTKRQYVMRKPIFPIEQPSILKKTLHQQWEMDASVSNVNESQHPTNNSLTMLDKNPVSYNLTPNDTASLHVCGSPLCSMDMTSGLQDEEHLFRPTLTRRKLVQYDPYSSIVEFQEKDLSVRPQLTSTILYSNSTPKIGQQDVKNKQICSLARQSRRRNMSYYEANYWECVIPKTLRKSTNGQNAALDPNREYQDLLDYTYPLRAEHIDNEWDSIGDSCQQQGLNTQDSGIELDSLCTIIPNGLDSNLGNRIESKALNDVDPKSNSTDRIASLLFFKTKSNDLLLDYVDFIDNDVVSCPHDIQSHHQSEQLSSVSLISRTSLISQSQYVDIDKEFWALPDHLKEGQLLTRQVTEVTTRLNCPVTAFCERMSSILPTISHNEKVIDADANQKGQKYNGNTTTNKKSAVKSGLIDGSLKEVEILMEQLDGLHLSNNQKLNLEDYHQNYSLTQHTHMFCSGLKQYISWLYTFSEKMNILARPTAENDNIRSSLAEYEKFQQEVRSQQYLTSHVLDTGDLLLKCINSTSPLLARTLQLIERQSKAMEKLTDHFFTSI